MIDLVLRDWSQSRETPLLKLFCLHSEKGSTVKGKNLRPLGANSFFLQ